MWEGGGKSLAFQTKEIPTISSSSFSTDKNQSSPSDYNEDGLNGLSDLTPTKPVPIEYNIKGGLDALPDIVHADIMESLARGERGKEDVLQYARTSKTIGRASEIYRNDITDGLRIGTVARPIRNKSWRSGQEHAIAHDLIEIFKKVGDRQILEQYEGYYLIEICDRLLNEFTTPLEKARLCHFLAFAVQNEPTEQTGAKEVLQIMQKFGFVKLSYYGFEIEEEALSDFPIYDRMMLCLDIEQLSVIGGNFCDVGRTSIYTRGSSLNKLEDGGFNTEIHKLSSDEQADILCRYLSLSISERPYYINTISNFGILDRDQRTMDSKILDKVSPDKKNELLGYIIVLARNCCQDGFVGIEELIRVLEYSGFIGETEQDLLNELSDRIGIQIRVCIKIADNALNVISERLFKEKKFAEAIWLHDFRYKINKERRMVEFISI